MPSKDLDFKAYKIVLECNGSIAEAARKMNISRETCRDRYHRYRNENVLNNKAEQKADRIKELEKIVEMQQEALDRQSHAKFKLPPAKVLKPQGAFQRVIIPDSHGSYGEKQAIAAFLHDLRELAPNVREIIHLGDAIDCGGFLAQHHVINYTQQLEYSFEDDTNAANGFFDQVQEACPHARISYLEGNHERRIETWCVTSALANKIDSAYLRKLFCVESVLDLEKRGIELYKQGVYYDDLDIPATIKRGHCYFTHGVRTGTQAARQTLADFGGNVVFGHTHRVDMHCTRNVKDGVIAAWNVGCLSSLQPLWRHTSVTGWSHAFGLQFVQDDGTFLHLTVPIIRGASYLSQFIDQFKLAAVVG